MRKNLLLLLIIPFVFLCSCSSKVQVPKDFNQMSAPKEGEDIAIIQTSMGEIRARLFTKVTPKTIENFTKLAKKSYYNGLIFHRVINNFMIQTGDPTGTGRGGESIWGKYFEDEITDKLYYYAGTLAMANTGNANTNGSQFFIVQNKTILPDEYYQGVSADEKTMYQKKGGYPLPHQYTIFGYVYQGMDVVDKIAAVPVSTDEATKDKPLQDVKMEKVTIEKYKSK